VADDGSVARSIVIEVLRRNGSEVSAQPAEPDSFFIVKGETFEIVKIPQVCGRKLVRYLSRKFTTHIHYFYNPLMLPTKTQEPIQ